MAPILTLLWSAHVCLLIDLPYEPCNKLCLSKDELQLLPWKSSKASSNGHHQHFEGLFKYQPGQVRAFGMTSGGSGITRMFQVTRVILESSKDSTKINLIYANGTYENILLKLAGRAGWFSSQLSQPLQSLLCVESVASLSLEWWCWICVQRND